MQNSNKSFIAVNRCMVYYSKRRKFCPKIRPCSLVTGANMQVIFIFADKRTLDAIVYGVCVCVYFCSLKKTVAQLKL